MEERQDGVETEPINADADVHEADPASDDHEGSADPADVPEADDPGDAGGSGGDESRERIERIVESVLFAAGAPVALRKLVEILGATGPRPTGKEVQAAVRGLQERYAADQRGIRLHDVAGGFQFRTARENAEWVRQLFREKPARLGRATLETLAIVAYKQPVTKAEIEAIRGVDVDGVLNTLLSRKLIKIEGRKEAVGRPLLYATTPEFLETFGLKDLNELPALHELGSITDGEEPASQLPEDAVVAPAATDGGATAEGTGAPAEAARATGEDGAADAGAGDELAADPAAPADDAAAAAAAETDSADPAAEWAASRAVAEDPQPGGDCVAAGGGDVDHGGADPGERADGDGTGGEGGPPPRPNHR